MLSGGCADAIVMNPGEATLTKSLVNGLLDGLLDAARYAQPP